MDQDSCRRGAEDYSSGSERVSCPILQVGVSVCDDDLCTICKHMHCRYLDAIERALANGDTLLIENMGESIDAVLDPLVGRNTIKKGRLVLHV